MKLALALLVSGFALAVVSGSSLPSATLLASNTAVAASLNNTENEVVPIIVAGGHHGSVSGEGTSLRDNNALLAFVMLFSGAVMLWGEM
jgi:hypothetical protein